MGKAGGRAKSDIANSPLFKPPLRKSPRGHPPPYLEVSEGEVPLLCVVCRGAWYQQRVVRATDHLTVVRILRWRSDAIAAIESGLLPIIVQLNLVQGEPLPCGYWVEALAHGKAAEQGD